MEIITGEARKRWSDDERLTILAEAIATGNVSRTARRYGVNPSMVFAWRKKLGAATEARLSDASPEFMPVLLSGEAAPEPAPTRHAAIEIEYGPLRMRIHDGASVDLAAAVARALAHR